jgi:predicted nucleic acid-binding protein
VLLLSGSDLSELGALTAQYDDRPMDFADATLVHLNPRLRWTALNRYSTASELH